MFRPTMLLFVFVAMGVLPACTSPCEELANEICACEGSLSAIDACERRATQTADILEPSDEDENRCDSFLETCDCHALDTPQGKRNCGLAE